MWAMCARSGYATRKEQQIPRGPDARSGPVGMTTDKKQAEAVRDRMLAPQTHPEPEKRT